jgi:1-deoxy-D-xylulose-5-phosphate reductoisomerase
MRRIALLGSTGSIGRQSLEVVESLPERLGVVALAAGSNLPALVKQIQHHAPELVSVADAERAAQLAALLHSVQIAKLPEIQHGPAGIRAVATHPSADVVVSAAVGVAGLEATYAAIRAGKQIALSNKEVLVAAGELVMAAARETGVELLPVDSEHNAIHQCLRTGRQAEVRRLVLTASGGPFRRTALAQVANATAQQALAHPTWKMGKRISIDSATLMNKGFEIIEAHWLFGLPLEKIEVVIHPQSTIHSLVEFVDSSILAQLGPTDMRLPIQYALTYPERVPARGWQFDWTRLRRLDFEKASSRRFPCLRLAREALRRGGVLPTALNAADEVAIAAFLEGRLNFGSIPRVIERVLERMSGQKAASMAEVLEADAAARQLAAEEVQHLATVVSQITPA